MAHLRAGREEYQSVPSAEEGQDMKMIGNPQNQMTGKSYCKYWMNSSREGGRESSIVVSGLRKRACERGVKRKRCQRKKGGVS